MWRAVLLAFLALPIQSSCVANDAMSDRSATCTIVGAEHLGVDGSDDRMCEDFRTRLTTTLNDAGMPDRADDLALDIEVQKGRAVIARVARADATGESEFPVVAIDVMDRPLRVSDLDRLADAVGRMLLRAN